MKNHLKRIVSASLLIALILLAACAPAANTPASSAAPAAPAASSSAAETPAPSSEAPAKPAVLERYSFTTSNAGGTWYTMCGGIATLINEKIGTRFTLDMIASGGSVENTRRLALGEADVSMSYSSHLWEAKNGVGIMEGAPSDLGRLMFQIYDSSHYFVTLKGKGIESMADLQGKKVVLGPPGSGSSDNSRRCLTALGITVEESELAFADGARALQDGLVDALGMSGHPSSGLVELANSKEILVIPFSDSEMDTIIKETPFYTKGVMEANVYKGQTEAVACPYFAVYLACSKDMPEEAVYEMMKVMFSDDGKKYLNDVHPQFAPMAQGAEAAGQIGVEFHPGALKFFSEQ